MNPVIIWLGTLTLLLGTAWLALPAMEVLTACRRRKYALVPNCRAPRAPCKNLQRHEAIAAWRCPRWWSGRLS